MLKYRAEIDGLRALAVIPVILFHAGFSLFSGGFVGVDVFFVISGYLITSIIILEKKSGTFTILGFYERRARRILPALFFVILICFPFAWVSMPPDQFNDLAKGTISVITFVSNIFFWRDGGYFSPDTALNPLIHTWSLAVEEQFYILFPVFIILFWRFGYKWIITLISIVALLSIGLSQFGGNFNFTAPYIDPKFYWFNQPNWASFYLPTGRAWEPLLGALAAFYLSVGSQPHTRINNVAAIAGLLLIVFAIVVFDKGTPFPSVYTVVPVIGTFLVIIFATTETIVSRVLSIKPLVAIGLISYSAYLIHQPVFSFYRVQYQGQHSSYVFFVLIAVSFIAAYFMWAYIERPFRNKAVITRKQIFSCAIAMSLFLLGGSLFVLANNGFYNRFPREGHQFLGSTKERGAYVLRAFQKQRAVDFKGNTQKQKIAIIGDSYAQDFFNIAVEGSLFSSEQIRTSYIPARCQIYLGPDDISKYINKNDWRLCEEKSILENAKNLMEHADIIILASSWQAWAVERLPQSISALSLRGNQKLIVVGGKYFGGISINKLMRTSREERLKLRNSVVQSHIEINNKMRKIFGADGFVDLQKYICGNDKTCPVFTPNGKLISYDGGHLTREGAKYIGKVISNHPLLKGLKSSKGLFMSN